MAEARSRSNGRKGTDLNTEVPQRQLLPKSFLKRDLVERSSSRSTSSIVFKINECSNSIVCVFDKHLQTLSKIPNPFSSPPPFSPPPASPNFPTPMRPLLIFFLLSFLLHPIFSFSLPHPYHTTASLISSLSNLSLSCPHLHISHLHHPNLSHPLPLLTFSLSNPPDPSLPSVLAVFNEHGRELITSELALHLSRRTCSNPSILYHANVYMLPIVNIPSRIRVESGIDTCSRKNERGVDLNRNFGYRWGEVDKNSNPSEEAAGPAAMSEGETRVVAWVARRVQAAAYLSVHSGGRAVLVPWDSGGDEGRKVWEEIGRDVGGCCCKDCSVGRVGEVLGYRGFGTGVDWMVGVLGVGVGVTVEVYGGKEGECWEEFNPVGEGEYWGVMGNWSGVLEKFVLGGVVARGVRWRGGDAGGGKVGDGEVWVARVKDKKRTERPMVLSVEDKSFTRRTAQKAPESWFHFLRETSGNDSVLTQRIGCREMQAGTQSCVFEGFSCINTSKSIKFEAPQVYFVMDGKRDMEEVYNDMWCQYRHQSSDPRYFSSRHWPIMQGTVVPQGSCLRAQYRTSKSMFGRNWEGLEKMKIKWVDSLWVVNLDYVDNDHNNHLVKDIVWMLDVMLWQKGMDLRPRPGDSVGMGEYNDTAGHLFAEGPQHVYLPQGENDFEKQTGRDVNRLTYSLILQRNLTKLYPNLTTDDLHKKPSQPRFATPLLEAFPDLKTEEKLIFHRNMIEDSDTELVCTPRLTVGAKIGNGAHERVCRYMRQESYKLFGIKEPEMKRIGSLYHPQPPKRVVILQRHVTRGIENIDELEKGLTGALGNFGVTVEIVSTDKIVSAEDYVRVFSRAGVLMTSHGSQSMGQIWMPRHSAIIEVMPVGYTDYAFNLLSESCKIWYYELQSKIPTHKKREDYEQNCGHRRPHLIAPCNEMKSVDVNVDVDQAVKKVRYAFERMGHEMGDWLHNVDSRGWMTL